MCRVVNGRNKKKENNKLRKTKKNSWKVQKKENIAK